MTEPDSVMRAAVTAFQEGHRAQAFLILKENRGMSLGDAKAAIQEAIQNIQKGDGVSVEQDQAMQKALDAVNTFDELTVMVLRQMRDTKQPISDRADDKGMTDDVLQKCATIYDCFRHLIGHDINPTRAMTTFLTHCCPKMTDPVTGRMQPALNLSECQAEMRPVIESSLRDDLLTLL